jgi:hypothetical protein
VAEADHNEDPWDLAGQERDRRQRWAATTPSERLRWLERAIRFAATAGTLPRPRR